MDRKRLREILEEYDIFEDVLFDSEQYEISSFDKETSHIQYIYDMAVGTSKLQKLDYSIWQPWEEIVASIENYTEPEIKSILIIATAEKGLDITVLTNPAMTNIIGVFSQEKGLPKSY